ncbi:MAG: Macrocin-O-methyltransferase protein [Gemmatimonadetes bacterium]|nr:Macrocin-O-methyltransferase protein [Gemmatimonadota bacterium]
MLSVKNLMRRVAARFGYEISVNTTPRSDGDGTFEHAREMVSGATMLPRKRLVSLYDQVVYCNAIGLQGSMVECGVWKGGAVGLMALALKSTGGPLRDLHLFDSFQGICEPDPAVDGELAIKEVGYRPDLSDGVIKAVKGIYDPLGGHGTVAESKALIEQRIGYPSARVHYHVGWFQDTVPVARDQIGPIALLRLDGDWYASTKVCLDNLYDLVVPGGFIILDDYGTYEGCRKATDEFLLGRGIQAYLHTVDRGCYYLIKPE